MRGVRAGLLIIGLAAATLSATPASAVCPGSDPNTPSTIVPLAVFFDWSPRAASPGSVITASDGGNNLCVENPDSYAEVSLYRSGSSSSSSVVATARTAIVNDGWSVQLVIPADAELGQYGIAARCAECFYKGGFRYGPVGYYGPFTFEVMPTQTGSTTFATTTTSLPATTSSSPPLEATIAPTTSLIVGDYVPTTTSVAVEAAGDTVAADPTAALPVTGGSSATGVVLGASLVVGGLLLVSRRRATKP
jgi:LPXTG-motif cell wall-anchored protein